MDPVSLEEVQFFQQRSGALPLYLHLREKIGEICPQATVSVKKTQISLMNRRLFGAVSFLPVRPAKARPDPFLTVTFGLGRQLVSPRIDAAVEAYPGRWTHHVMIGTPEEADAELLDWLAEAAAFSAAKR